MAKAETLNRVRDLYQKALELDAALLELERDSVQEDEQLRDEITVAAQKVFGARLWLGGIIARRGEGA